MTKIVESGIFTPTALNVAKIVSKVNISGAFSIKFDVSGMTPDPTLTYTLRVKEPWGGLAQPHKQVGPDLLILESGDDSIKIIASESKVHEFGVSYEVLQTGGVSLQPLPFKVVKL